MLKGICLHLSVLGLLMAWALPGQSQSQADPAMPREQLREQLRALVEPLLMDDEIQAPGLQVGIVTPGYTGSFAWGSLDHQTQQTPRPDTIYDIASLTKPLVATLVSQDLLAGRMRLQDPLVPCQPRQTSALCFDGQAVTWLDLLTHSSGLPALPDNLRSDSWQPTHDYTRGQLSDFLNTYRLSAPPGGGFRYSSLGYAVIGRQLEALHHQTLAQQLQKLTNQLGMPDTRVHLNHEQKLRLASGYVKHLPIPDAEVQEGLTASGGLKSSLADLLVWLQHQLGSRKSAWSPAMIASHQLTGRAGAPFCQMALGWLYFNPAGWYWHSGSGAGFKSFLAYDLKHHTGVVILLNARVTGFKVEPVGMRIMGYLNRVSWDKPG